MSRARRAPARRRRPARPWRLVPHTADLAVALQAPTLARLLDAGADAIVALAHGKPETVPVRRRLRLEVRGSSREDLLVRWLQEILFVQETRGWRFRRVRVDALRVRDLVARGTGRGGRSGAGVRAPGGTAPRGGREIKAVTYHGLRIVRRGGFYCARVVLDV